MRQGVISHQRKQEDSVYRRDYKSQGAADFNVVMTYLPLIPRNTCDGRDQQVSGLCYEVGMLIKEFLEICKDKDE